jgi:flagellin
MALTINTNVMSLNTQRNLNSSQGVLANAMQRLSSGLRVNSAKDDAAGLAISERMTSQIRGLGVAMRNANDAISLAQVAEGGLGKVADAMQRMRELAVQSANATNTTADRAALDTEFQALADEIDRVIGGTSFNGVNVLATATTQIFQVGAGTTANDTISVATSDLSGDATITAVTGAASDITDVANATAAIDDVDAALTTINTQRGNWGAAQNRFESVIATLSVAKENVEASRGRIVDADYAHETAQLTRAQILQQAGTAMLAQANAAPQNVLSLLR